MSTVTFLEEGMELQIEATGEGSYAIRFSSQEDYSSTVSLFVFRSTLEELHRAAQSALEGTEVPTHA